MKLGHRKDRKRARSLEDNMQKAVKEFDRLQLEYQAVVKIQADLKDRMMRARVRVQRISDAQYDLAKSRLISHGQSSTVLRAMLVNGKRNRRKS